MGARGGQPRHRAPVRSTQGAELGDSGRADLSAIHWSTGAGNGDSVAARRLSGRFVGRNAALLSAVGGLLAIGVAYALLPRVNETPARFRAGVLWPFRIASTATQATVWSTLGLILSGLACKFVGCRDQAAMAWGWILLWASMRCNRSSRSVRVNLQLNGLA
ncbi:MAG: CbtA family protein, partial [Frankiaceae bacterium]